MRLNLVGQQSNAANGAVTIDRAKPLYTLWHFDALGPYDVVAWISSCQSARSKDERQPVGYLMSLRHQRLKGLGVSPCSLPRPVNCRRLV
jgi:hypothetical protein